MNIENLNKTINYFKTLSDQQLDMQTFTHCDDYLKPDIDHKYKYDCKTPCCGAGHMFYLFTPFFLDQLKWTGLNVHQLNQLPYYDITTKILFTEEENKQYLGTVVAMWSIMFSAQWHDSVVILQCSHLVERCEWVRDNESLVKGKKDALIKEFQKWCSFPIDFN